MYIQKGAEIAPISTEPGGRVKSAFLEVPLLLKLEFGQTIKPYVMTGPTLGYLLSSDLEVDVNSITFKGDMKNVTNKIDFGYAFGAGISVPFNSFSIFCEGKNNHCIYMPKFTTDYYRCQNE